MTDNAAVVWMTFARCAACAVATLAAYYLAKDGKEGWGWFVFLAVVLGSFSTKSGD